MTFEEGNRKRIQQHWSKRLASQGPIARNETLEKIIEKYHLRPATDTMESHAQSATPPSNISEDATNATIVDGANVNDSFPKPPIGLGPGDEYCVSPDLYVKKTYKLKLKKENTNA